MKDLEQSPKSVCVLRHKFCGYSDFEPLYVTEALRLTVDRLPRHGHCECVLLTVQALIVILSRTIFL